MSDVLRTGALFRPVMVLMSGRMLGFIAAFVIPVVLARVFDQSDFGTYKQLFLIHATLFAFAQLGMAESLYYFLPMAGRNGGAYILNAMGLMGAAGLLCALALWGLAEPISALLNNPSLALYLPYIGLYLLLILLGVILEIVLTVQKQHFGASVSYAGTDLARAVLFVAPVLWVADLGWLMSGALTFALLRVAVTLVFLKQSRTITLRTDKRFLRQHLAYALPFGAAGMIEVLQLNFHLYAVSYYFDAATFAIYAVGCLQVPLIDILMTSTSNVMMINMRHQVIQQDLAGALATWLDAVRKISFLLFPLVSLLLLTAPLLIVLLFGESYRASIPVFMVWSASTILVCLLTDGVMRVFAQNRYLIIQNILRLLIVMSLIHVFLERWQLIGAVLVTTLAAVIVKGVALYRVSQLLQVPLSGLLPYQSQLRTLFICALASLPCLLLIKSMLLSGIAALFAISAVFTLSYLALLLWFGPLTREEKSQMLTWTRNLPGF